MSLCSRVLLLQLADIMERSKGIYEARDKSQSNMLQLKEHADRKVSCCCRV